MKKARKTHKFSSVSVDGTSPVIPSSQTNADISKKKLERVVNNSATSVRMQQKATSSSSDEQKTAESRLIDNRLKESIDVIKCFLNFPPDAEFTVDVMVSEFLRLIKNYVKLNEKYNGIIGKIRAKESEYGTCQSMASSWN